MTNEDIRALNLSSPVAQQIGLGNLMSYALNGITGKQWFLDTVNGDDSNDGLSPATAMRTLPVSYGRLTANKNEILFVMGGESSLVLSAAVDWAKSYTHMIGIGGNLRFGGRVRIGHTGTALATMFTISGSGCVFNNIHFQHGQASATNLVCVSVTGLRNEFENCHFEASLDSVASGSTYSWRSVSLGNGAQANTFKRCTFGSWTTVWASANGVLLYFGTDTADTFVEDCIFNINTSSTSMVPVAFAGALSGAQSAVYFINTGFMATNALPAVVFGQPSNGFIHVIKSYHNCTAWATTNASIMEYNGAASTSGTGKGAAQA